MKNYKMSIVVPAYNLEKYITKTLKSLENQTYKNLEVIVVNDGSKDNTSEVAKQFFMQTKLEYKIIDKVNGGVSDARNIGIKKATGEFIMFLDGDDYIDENTVEKVINKFIDTDVDFIYCGTNIVDENNKILSKYSENSFLNSDVISGKEMILKLLKQEVEVIPMHALFCKTSIIKENNLSFTKGCANGEDQEFYFLYLCHCSKVVSINEYLSYYVQRKTSISNTFNFNKFGVLEALDRIKIYLKKYIDEITVDKLMENLYKREFFTNFNSIIKFSQIDNDKVYDVLDKYEYILKMGNYKIVNNSRGEKVFAIRYLMMRKFPRLYVNLFKFLYKKRGK